MLLRLCDLTNTFDKQQPTKSGNGMPLPQCQPRINKAPFYEVGWVQKTVMTPFVDRAPDIKAGYPHHLLTFSIIFSLSTYCSHSTLKHHSELSNRLT